MIISSESKVIDTKCDERYMRMALEEAEAAGQSGEVPVGAILVKGDRVLARNHNRCIELHDPTAHAEILVLRQGGEVLKNYRLVGTALYVTVEPCPMCASAMIHGRISRLIFGAREPKFGAVESTMRLFKGNALNHSVALDHGVLDAECIETMKGFFKKKRAAKKIEGSKQKSVGRKLEKESGKREAGREKQNTESSRQ